MEQRRLNPGILTLEPELFNPYVPHLKTRRAWETVGGSKEDRRRCKLIREWQSLWGWSEGSGHRRRGHHVRSCSLQNAREKGEQQGGELGSAVGASGEPAMNSRKVGWGS